MIDRKEIRVGNNILNPFGYIVEVAEVRKDAIHLTDGNGGTLSSFEPVPLTPEILEAAGFSYSKGEKTNRIFYSKGSISFFADNIGFTMWNIFVTIHYAHQLQNLYFTLTGTELTINLLQLAQHITHAENN